MDAILCAKAQKKMFGITKSEILNRQADGCGSGGKSFLTCPSGMSPDNPFKSKAQQRFMFAKKPKMAKKWAAKTPSISKLPEKVGK